MANGSSSALPWVIAGASGVVAALALGFVAGRYTAPEVVAPAAPQQQAAAQDPNALPPGASSEKIGDWTLACQDLGNNKKSCVALQAPVDSQNRIVAAVLAGYDDQAKRVFIVRAPLGVMLDKGLEFTMPNDKPEAFGFGACNQQSCDAQLGIADDGYAKLEAAGTFQIGYTLTNGEHVSANVSMKGLTDAYAKIEKPTPAAAPAPAADPAAPATPPATPAPEEAPAPKPNTP